MYEIRLVPRSQVKPSIYHASRFPCRAARPFLPLPPPRVQRIPPREKLGSPLLPSDAVYAAPLPRIVIVLCERALSERSFARLPSCGEIILRTHLLSERLPHAEA